MIYSNVAKKWESFLNTNTRKIKNVKKEFLETLNKNLFPKNNKKL